MILIFLVYLTGNPCLTLEADPIASRKVPDAEEYLTQGQRIDQSLPSGVSQSYSIDMDAGQFLRLEIFSPSQNLAVLLFSPDGKRHQEWMIRYAIKTPVSMIAESGGTYRLELRWVHRGVPGNVPLQLRVTALRRSALPDQRDVIACRNLSEAVELRDQWDFASNREAIRKYEKALSYWRKAGDRLEEASTLKAIGDILELLADYPKALSSYQSALKIWRELNTTWEQAAVLNAIGSVYVTLGKNQEAREVCSKALDLAKVSEDPWTQSEALQQLGRLSYGTDKIDKAVDFLQKAVQLRKKVNDQRGLADTYLTLGNTYHSIKETDTARGFYMESLNLFRTLEDRFGEALCLASYGDLLNILGDRQEALTCYEDSLKLLQPIGNKGAQASVYHGIAYLYAAMGDHERALPQFMKALALARDSSNALMEAYNLTYIGEIQAQLGNYQESLSYSRQAVAAHRAVSSLLGESYTMVNIGKVYEWLKDEHLALENYNQALLLSRKAGDQFLEGILLNMIGHVYFLKAEILNSLQYFQDALALQVKTGDLVGQPATFYNLALAKNELGRLDEAIRHTEQALELTESLRGKVASPGLRSSFVASVHQQYELAIEMLMRRYRDHSSGEDAVRAFAISERARARSLLEGLAGTKTDRKYTGDSDLLKQRAELQERIDGLAEQQMRLTGKKSDTPKGEAMAREMSELTAQYDRIQSQIRARVPISLEQAHFPPLTLTEVQDQLLDKDSLLLEYSLGDSRSYLWAVTQGEMTSHVLPNRAEIEKIAREVYERLITRLPKPGETASQYQNRVKGSDALYWQQAAALSQVLLGPVADQLGKRRLLIVAEGALQYIPFAALPKPQGHERPEDTHPNLTTAAPLKGGISGQAGMVTSREKSPSPHFSSPVGDEGKISLAFEEGRVPLIVNHEIVNLPSASALAVLRQEIANRQEKVPKAVAVLADPVFEADDPRVSKRESSGSRLSAHMSSNRDLSLPTSSDLQIALRDVGMTRGQLSIPRLPSTRQEAEAILAVCPANSCLEAVDFKASRETALSPELGQFRIVHFATHGLLNSQHPELSGLVLSLVDEQGKSQNGFLRLHEIYNLHLPADLVVLSACNTGLGKEIKGEGLVGIVRGFMYAGAARVVASLWKVDDEATSELMKRFYQSMVQEKMSPAAALRSAQVALSQQKKWRSPYYWAGFVLQGEYR